MKLALAQMRIEPGEKEINLSRAEHWMARAAEQGSDVVLLPEAFSLGWTHPSARVHADGIPDGETCARLRAAAVREKIFVCAGVIERCDERIFNSAVLLGPNGEMLNHHRKIYELDIAQDLYVKGDRLSVAETPFGRIGVMICADGFAPGQSISRALALMGARYILSPCAWAVPADHDNVREYGQLWLDNYGPVAREFGVAIAGASNVGPITAGPWQGRKCIGNSLVVGSHGTEIARGPYGENAEMLMIVDL